MLVQATMSHSTEGKPRQVMTMRPRTPVAVMTSMNMPTPMRIAMTGVAVRMASGTVLSTLIFLPVNRPTAADSRKMTGMPRSSVSFRILKKTMRMTRAMKGR